MCYAVPMTEAERVERFETAYNRIDRALADMVDSGGNRRRHSYAARVRIAAERQRRLAKHADFLVEIGELRNALVHSRTGEDEYLAVPNEKTVLELEEIERRLFSPEKVVPRFERGVDSLQANQTLADVLALIREDGYSRYPVYENGGFIGLLTSNGVARWLASHVRNGKIDLDLASVRIVDVLAKDHRREAVAFVSREALVDDVDVMFSGKAKLEAVIITPSGKPHEQPLGMICAPDIAALR